MSWFRRTATRVKKSRGYASQSRTVDDAVTSHLTQFARSRRGVEAFVEPLQIPGYDAAVVGYPQRMRDYNTRNKKHPDLR